MDAFFQRLWYGKSRSRLALVLLPLSWLFALVVGVRSLAFKAGLLSSVRVGRPVIVVGNITVGGTGKTPLVLWLAERFVERGRRPGIIARGYGGAATSWPQDVMPESDPAQVGDEPVLLATRSRCIVVAGPDRVAAARRAIERGADVILSDDGLQHYRLARDCELAVLDAGRGIGNGRLLPLGPLREPASRLETVDAVLVKAGTAAEAEEIQHREHVRMAAQAVGSMTGLRIPFHIEAGSVRSLATGKVQPLEAFRGRPVHALAAIGHPEAFFATLRRAQVIVLPHALPDHAALKPADLRFDDDLPVLMTEKDAVKCARFADERLWAVIADATIAAPVAAKLLSTIEARLDLNRKLD